MDHGSMKMFLHLSFGDALFFESWKPKSAGAVAGAAIGLALLAICDRWLAAMRAVLEIQWAARFVLNFVHCLGPYSSTFRPAGYLPTPSRLEEEKRLDDTIDNSASSVSAPDAHASHGRFKRTVPPLVWSRDLTRGALYALQSLLSYLLMLAVMCDASYPLKFGLYVLTLWHQDVSRGVYHLDSARS